MGNWGQTTVFLTHYVRAALAAMKSATLPAVRVEPELRNELEAVLGVTESISAFVEAAVRNAVNVVSRTDHIDAGPNQPDGRRMSR